MKHLFWIVPGVLAGRSGPTKDPWNLDELARNGIGAVLSVNDGALCHADDFVAAGLRYKCIPLSPNAPPQPGDLELCASALPVAYEFTLDNERNGIATLVHCHSGKDRTGLFLAYYLSRRFALDARTALSRVRDARPIAFTALGWDQFVLDVLEAVQS